MVIKRDGRQVLFDEERIISAVLKAFKAVDGDKFDKDYAYRKANNIAQFIKQREEEQDLSVEEIQDFVEHGLMATKRKDVAIAYIEYRRKRSVERTKNSDLRRRVREKLAAKNVQNQNANVDEKSFGGRIGEASDEQMRDIALNEIMSEKSRYNHINNKIYIHDLSQYAAGNHNCMSIPFDDLLANGFKTRQTDIRPANSINTAFQLLAVIFQLQSLQQFGGCAATHLDWTMVPYVRKSFTKHLGIGLRYIEKLSEYKVKRFYKWLENDSVNHADKTIHFDDTEFKLRHPDAWDYAMDMTKKELNQAVEAMYHNLNSLQSRSGNQLPFTSINYGTCTLLEGRMVIKALLEGSLKGIGRLHKTSIFPCGIFQLGNGINKKPSDPNYDLFKLAIKSTAKRLYPNYANIDWSGNAGYDKNDPKTYFSTMGCRTANGWDINGFGQLKDGRGNICPVTIIMPTIAMEIKESLDRLMFPDGYSSGIFINAFLKALDKTIHEAKDMLIERYEWICSQSADSAKFMYENNVIAGYVPEEGIRSALKHCTLSIGQLGLAETLQILIGKDHTTEEGMELAKHIEQLFKDRCAEFKKQYKLNFGVYYTPAENLCYTSMQKFKEKYGTIPNVSDKDFFTNSVHVPVWKEISPFDKIDIESQLTGYSSAGCITYVELDGKVEHNLEALEQIILYAMDKDIPYFAINVPNDTCCECGYTGELGENCPECGSHDIERLRRVTGYLSTSHTHFNPGKIQEVEMRYKHSKKLSDWTR